MALGKVIESENGIVRVTVRRNNNSEGLYGLHTDLRVGDKVEVKRVVNNPYLVRVIK
jgi:ferredoxin-NADP reductase